jgi:heptosyltransferase-2
MFGSVSRVLAYDRSGDNGAIAQVAGTVGVDVVVDLQNSLRSRRIARWFAVGRTVRFKRQRFRRFLRVYAPWLWRGPLKDTTEAYADVIRKIGVQVRDCVPAMQPPGELVSRLAGKMEVGAAIGVCPGGSSRYKRWGEARFADLVKMLVHGGNHVLLVGAEIDRPVVEAVSSCLDGMPVGVFIANDIDMLASVLSLCRVVVANDSGLMHLAGAVGSKVVALFGPTSPVLGFAPKARCSRVVSRNLPCSPCSYHGNRPCKLERRACLDDIDPEAVARVVTELLGEECRIDERR